MVLLKDDADEEEVDKKLEGGIEEPPHVAEQRVRAPVSDLGDRQVPDKTAPFHQGAEALKDGANAASARPANRQFGAVGGHERARIAPVPPILPLTRPRLKEDH